MKVSCTPIGKNREILASSQFQAVPVFIAGTDAVKAGMPVKDDGSASPDGTGATGILLYDVDPSVNPNGAAVVQGVLNWNKCREISGASADAQTMKTILPGIVFRENAGAAKNI